MHFTWEISFGQIVLGAPLVTLALYMLKIHRVLVLFRLEHEYLMKDWASRQTPAINVDDLPTRRPGW